MTDNTETTPERLRDRYDERKHIRWDSTVNLGHLISAGVALFSALTFAIGVYILINSRVVILEEAKTYQLQKDLQQDVRMQEKFIDVQRALERIESNQNEMRRDMKERR